MTTQNETARPVLGRKVVIAALAVALAAMFVTSLAYRFTHPSMQKAMRPQAAQATGGAGASMGEGMGEGMGMDMDAVREMLAALEERIEADPGDVEALLQAANIYLMRRDAGHAEGYIERAHEAAKDDTMALMQVAKLYFDIGEFEPAREAMGRILELEPENMFARFNMGVLLKYRLEKPKEAEEYFRQVAEGEHGFDELREEAKKELQ
jgi:Flp pilus assembly protein TadD